MPIPTYRSTSQRRTLKTCGWKYYLRYDQGYFSKVTKPGMLLGSICHKTLELAFRGEIAFTADAIEAHFLAMWDEIKDRPGISWSKYRKWDVMRPRAGQMMRLTTEWLLEHVDFSDGQVAVPEWNLRFQMHGGSEELVIVDLYSKIDGLWTALDFKTSDRDYDELRPILDEQLTAGQLAIEQNGKRVEQVGLLVLQYGTQPKIQPLMVPARKAAEIVSFVSSAKTLDDQIQRREFHKNPDACFQFGRCEMYPLCYPSERGQLDELVEKRETITAEEEALLGDE